MSGRRSALVSAFAQASGTQKVRRGSSPLGLTDRSKATGQMGLYSASGLFLRLRQRGQKVEPVEARIFVTCSLVVGELLGAGQERLLRDIVPGQANVEGWYGSAYGNGSVATVRPLDWRRGAGWNRRGELDVAAGAPRNTKAVMHVCVLTTARGGSGFQAQLPYDLRRRCSRSSTTCSGNFGISAARAGALQPAHRFHSPWVNHGGHGADTLQSGCRRTGESRRASPHRTSLRQRRARALLRAHSGAHGASADQEPAGVRSAARRL